MMVKMNQLLAGGCALVLAGSSQAALNWDFDTGDGLTPSLNDWTIIANGDPGINSQPLIQVDGSERNRLGADPVLTTAWDRDGKAGGFVGDSAHPILIARSPSFTITEVGDITWDTAGGNASATQEPVLSAGSYNAGAQGVVLVRESDGVMIASAISNSQGARSDTMDIGSLGLLNDGIAYYLETVDNRSGGWGYVEWDNFSIPGVLVGACSPGDTDGDGDIDTGDLTTSIQNFTGAGGSTTQTCEEGDTDEDGDVDTGDLTFSIQNFTGAQAGNPNVPDLVYDPATGNVTIDADGADVISFSLQSGPFNAADFSELPAGLTDNIASQIGWTSFNLFSGLTGTADLGAILPAGLELAGLEAALTTASYGLALAGGGGGGRLDLIIPEPASMVLMGLGAMAMVRRRRAA